MLNKFYTPRLMLRSPIIEDASGVFDYASDERVSLFMSWPTHQRIADSISFLASTIERRKTDDSFLNWSIIRREDQKFLGLIDLRKDSYKGEVGYALNPVFWNQGYMSEAFKGLIDMAFAEDKNLYRIAAICDTTNIGSYRVMEKAGLKREGILRGYFLAPRLSDQPRDVYSYSIIR